MDNIDKLIAERRAKSIWLTEDLVGALGYSIIPYNKGWIIENFLSQQYCGNDFIFYSIAEFILEKELFPDSYIARLALAKHLEKKGKYNKLWK